MSDLICPSCRDSNHWCFYPPICQCLTCHYPISSMNNSIEDAIILYINETST